MRMAWKRPYEMRLPGANPECPRDMATCTICKQALRPDGSCAICGGLMRALYDAAEKEEEKKERLRRLIAERGLKYKGKHL